MIQIVKQIRKTVKHVIHIQENPTPGSFGDYLLLKNDLFSREDPKERGFFSSPQFEQLMFNTKFLIERELKYGELHCEYCGKGPLRIYSWTEHSRKADMATTDHILPKKDYPELAKVKSNSAVCCAKCNHKKDRRLWDIKFPYKEKKDEQSIIHSRQIESGIQQT